jgi:pimeloyl-ACP methyl ester carboxylesterase
MGVFRWIGRGVALGGAVAAGGALFVTARHVLTTPQPLQSGLDGVARIDRKHGGDVYYTVAGPEDAQPVVLIHDFYPGASSYEYRSVFGRLARQYRVYAPDWLGFGMSERPPLAFTGEFYATALAGFLRDVVQQPAIVIAHGRAANVAARAASDEPELFERLALVSPEIEAGMRLDPTVGQTVVRTAQRASLGMLPYALLSTRTLLRRLALGRADGAASEDALDHQYASAHQFGGQHALLALLTGDLDLPVQHELPLIQPPLLLIAGDRDTQRAQQVMEDVAILNPYAELEIIPAAGESVFEDQPLRFLAVVNAWIERPALRQRTTATQLTPAQARTAAARPEETNEATNSAGMAETQATPVSPPVESETGAETPIAPEITPEATPGAQPDTASTSTSTAARKRTTIAKSAQTAARKPTSASSDAKPAPPKPTTSTGESKSKSGSATPTTKASVKQPKAKTPNSAKKASETENA